MNCKIFSVRNKYGSRNNCWGVKNLFINLSIIALIFVFSDSLSAQESSHKTNDAVLTKAVSELGYSALNRGVKKQATLSNAALNNAGKSEYNYYLPVNAQASVNENEQGVITWEEPAVSEFRYDNGIPKTSLGYNNSENSILGSVFPENTIIESASWFTGSDNSHDSVDVVILGLDESNMPNINDILYWKKHANIDDSWTTVEFAEKIAAPNGYFIGLHTSDFISIMIDSGTDPIWPFVMGVHYGIGNYTAGNGGWTLLEDMGFNNNIMVRTKGYTLPETKSSKSDLSYNVYRIDMETQAKTGLAADLLVLNYTDTELNLQADGFYKYGITAVYPDGIESDITYSNQISKGMHFEFTVNVTSVSGNSVEGAYVMLTNHDGDVEHKYTMTAPEGGICVFPSVFIGNYKLYVAYTEHAPKNINDISIMDDASVNVSIEPFFVAPEINEVILNDNTALLKWNKISTEFFDDFESYDDFVINFPPWVSLNVDGGTVMAFWDVFYENAGEPQAGIIYNKRSALPRVGQDPYSGEKYLAVFNAGPSVFDTDKWNIAPEVLIKSGYIVSFQGTAGNEMWSEEVFQVFASTGEPVVEDMIPVSPVITYPKGVSDWVLYTFDLSAFAGQTAHVGIHLTSYDQFYFCVDDFYVGPSNTKGAPNSDITYNLYLNDMETPVATGIDYSQFKFLNIPAGTNTVGVQAVYQNGVSLISTQEINITDISSAASIQLSLYPNPAKDVVTIVSDKIIDGITVYNSLGQQIYSQQQNNTKSIQLNTDSYNQGIYFVVVKSGNKFKTEYLTVTK